MTGCGMDLSHGRLHLQALSEPVMEIFWLGLVSPPDKVGCCPCSCMHMQERRGAMLSNAGAAPGPPHPPQSPPVPWLISSEDI